MDCITEGIHGQLEKLQLLRLWSTCVSLQIFASHAGYAYMQWCSKCCKLVIQKKKVPIVVKLYKVLLYAPTLQKKDKIVTLSSIYPQFYLLAVMGIERFLPSRHLQVSTVKKIGVAIHNGTQNTNERNTAQKCYFIEWVQLTALQSHLQV